MDAPKCRLCEKKHYGPCAIDPIGANQTSAGCQGCIAKDAEIAALREQLVTKVSSSDEPHMPFDRKVYMRDYMRKYRKEQRE